MIHPFQGRRPKIDPSAFVAPSADIIGDVELGAECSVWFQVVIRGDVRPIRIGARSNIQDQSTLHCTRTKKPLVIGEEVTVGHRVMLHGCEISDRVLIGMGAILMDDVKVESDCIIGAGSLLTQGFKVPSGHLAVGVPAKVVRPLTSEELAFLKTSAANYVRDRLEYKEISL